VESIQAVGNFVGIWQTVPIHIGKKRIFRRKTQDINPYRTGGMAENDGLVPFLLWCQNPVGHHQLAIDKKIPRSPDKILPDEQSEPTRGKPKLVRRHAGFYDVVGVRPILGPESNDLEGAGRFFCDESQH
jgi:hypothetical protein